MREGPKRTRRGGPTSTLLGVLAGVLLGLLVVVAVVVIFSRGNGSVQTASPVSAPDVEVLRSAPPRPVRTARPDEATRAAVLAAERKPEEADAAAFIASYNPPGGRDVESVTVDLDGDGSSEVIVASIVADVSRVDVATWNGRRYVVSFTGQGGPAEVLESFHVRDVTGDGSREIVLHQLGAERRSLALWGVTPDGVARQAGRGGCWDGSHVYGQRGAEVDDGELVATCDPSVADVAPGSEATYRWNGQGWVVDPGSPD